MMCLAKKAIDGWPGRPVIFATLAPQRSSHPCPSPVVALLPQKRSEPAFRLILH
jgi:hypothetical protein